jgi:hypothetical protein
MKEASNRTSKVRILPDWVFLALLHWATIILVIMAPMISALARVGDS